MQRQGKEPETKRFLPGTTSGFADFSLIQSGYQKVCLAVTSGRPFDTRIG